MRDRSNKMIGRLLAEFFSTGAEQLQFLTQEHDFQCINGLASMKNGLEVIRPYHGQQPVLQFRAKRIYERADINFEVIYCGKDACLEAYMYDDADRYSVIALSGRFVSKQDHEPDIGLLTTPLTTPEQIKAAIIELSLTIASRPDLYEGNSAAQQRRQKKITTLLREAYLQDMLACCEQAGQAFLDRDYKQVVTLLRPYQQGLSPADAKKLELAIKRLLTPPLL